MRLQIENIFRIEGSPERARSGGDSRIELWELWISWGKHLVAWARVIILIRDKY